MKRQNTYLDRRSHVTKQPFESRRRKASAFVSQKNVGALARFPRPAVMRRLRENRRPEHALADAIARRLSAVTIWNLRREIEFR
jgi:hypothetical protein